MRIMTAEELFQISKKLFIACGVSENDARIVSTELIDASLMGLDSHGFMRVAQYIREIQQGLIEPNAQARIERETNTTAVVDCANNLGMVSANLMVDIAEKKALDYDISCITSHHAQHIGRLGAYVQKLAERGLIGFAVANGTKASHWVAPWGGREGRLATNPLAFAAPTSGNPVVLDMSTSMLAEGKIRVFLQEGKQLPENCVLDSEGKPTIEPSDFYGPPKGTILPFGGNLGYKGFGLSLLVEILGSTLGGTPVPKDGEPNEYLNGLTIIAIRPGAFSDNIYENMDRLCEYITSCPPCEGSRGVVMPGYYDFATRDRRSKEGIPVANATWEELVQTARTLGIVLE